MTEIERAEKKLEVLKRLDKYEKLGWEFKEEESISYHNGDISDDYYFKSPRMKELKLTYSNIYSLHSYSPYKEDKLLEEEAKYCMEAKMEKWEDYGGLLEKFKDSCEEVLKDLYLKKKEGDYSDKAILETALKKL